MTSIDLVVGTLNTSTGPIVTAAQLEAALRAGSLDAIDDSSARASVSYLFVEFVLHLDAIRNCCTAIGVSIDQAHKLYLQTIAEGMPHVPAWENEVSKSTSTISESENELYADTKRT